MGRDSYSHRRILEYSAGIRIQDLKDYGLLNRGSLKARWNLSITQTRGVFKETLADCIFTVQLSNTDRLSNKNFIHFDYDYHGQHISFKHLIEIQPVHFGGYRYYFKCCCTKNGQYCGRRVKALYFGGTVWACRHCLELVYAACRLHRDRMEYGERARILQARAERYRRNKHPRKAKRLLRIAEEYEYRADIAYCEIAEKLLTRGNRQSIDRAIL